MSDAEPILMDNEEFLQYVEIHCNTERSGFVTAQVLRLYDLAGVPIPFTKNPLPGPYEVHTLRPGVVLPLVSKARHRLHTPTKKPAGRLTDAELLALAAILNADVAVFERKERPGNLVFPS